MNRFVVTVLAAAVLAWCAPDAGGDKSVIEKLLSEFNSATAVNDFGRLVAMFAKDGDYGVDGAAPIAAAAAIRQAPPKRLPWDERMPLAMKVQKIRFIRPGVAVADAIESDSSPMMGDSRRWSCTFIFVRVGGDWKIESYREFSIPSRPR